MNIKSKLLALGLIGGGAMFAQTRFSVGISVGGYNPGYYQPNAYAQQYVPPCPGPGYTWVDGYWSPYQGRRVWTNGYWRTPLVIAPRYNASGSNAWGFRDRDGHDRGNRYNNRDRHDDRGNGHRR
jgi:hypothetical protein